MTSGFQVFLASYQNDTWESSEHQIFSLTSQQDTTKYSYIRQRRHLICSIFHATKSPKVSQFIRLFVFYHFYPINRSCLSVYSFYFKSNLCLRQKSTIKQIFNYFKILINRKCFHVSSLFAQVCETSTFICINVVVDNSINSKLLSSVTYLDMYIMQTLTSSHHQHLSHDSENEC